MVSETSPTGVTYDSHISVKESVISWERANVKTSYVLDPVPDKRKN